MTEPKPETTGGQQVGGRFRKGRSGNPSGRPEGARHKSTLAIEALLEGEAEAIGRKCIELAKEGDAVALRLAMERIAPVRRGRPVKFDMPPVASAADVVTAIGSVLHAVSTGELTPEEAATLASVLEAKRRAIEIVEIERRLGELEGQLSRRNY
jgi:hypothetical protein